MTHAFDKDYWETHWQRADGRAPDRQIVPNPYLPREISHLAPSTALDAGCGEGAEAIWLATEGWLVTAADISLEVLSRARERAGKDCAARDRVQWVEADLSVWEPATQFALVTTHYAHPSMPQLEFYDRLSGWVAPGGTLLIVGHRPTAGHGHHPPEAVSVTAASITATLDGTQWDIVTADEPTRTRADRSGRPVQLNDVVVRAIRCD
jgi:SAM-dependent methyltransferase